MIATFANFIFIFFAERARTPQIVREVSTITTNHLIVVTNYIATVASNDFVRSMKKYVGGEEVTIPYTYFLSDGFPCFRMYNRNFTFGSPTSYGRVEKIFPDRVLLDSGVWIKNGSVANSNRREVENDGVRDK